METVAIDLTEHTDEAVTTWLRDNGVKPTGWGYRDKMTVMLVTLDSRSHAAMLKLAFG